MKNTILKSFIVISFISLVVTQNSNALSRPIVSKIETKAKSNSIITVSWELPEESEPMITSICIFRDTKAISTYDQLELLTPIATLASDVTSYDDKITDGKDYFYSVIAITENGRYNIILPTINTTVYGTKKLLSIVNNKDDTVSVKEEKLYPNGKIREIPLPSPDILENQHKEPIPMGKKVNDEIGKLAGEYANKKPTQLEPYYFGEDMIAPVGGDDYLLFKTLRETLVIKDYKKSVSSLTDFLSVHREENTSKRAKFYLGEALYFSKNYKDALYIFLSLKETYPDLSKKWCDSCLDLLTL